jgi:hypothetical protein
LENCLLLEEVEKLMENYEEEGGLPQGESAQEYREEELNPLPQVEASPARPKTKGKDRTTALPEVGTSSSPAGNKKKKLDYDQLDDKSILIMYKLNK